MILLVLAGAAAASEPLSPECSGMMAAAVAAAPRHDPSKPALANGVFLVADRDLVGSPGTELEFAL